MSLIILSYFLMIVGRIRSIRLKIGVGVFLRGLLLC